MNPAAQAAAEHLARRAEAVVKAALDKRLGRADWSPEEIQPRVHVDAAPDGDTYYLDGAAFLWMGRPVVRQDEDGGPISVDREWRELP